MQLNRLYFDEDDPTKLYGSFIILDFEVSGNGVIVSEEVALDGSKSLKNMPIVTKFNGDDFGSHEYVEEVVNGKKKVVRDTIPIGVFSTEGYIEEIEIDGVTKRVLMADGLLWYSRFRDACDLLYNWIEEGTKVNMSCEYLYKNISIIDDIEYHLKPIYFDGHCILSTKIKPAYDTATIVDTSEFNMLVAQAINQEKDEEDTILAEEKLETQENVEEVESEKSTEETVETTEEETVETQEVVVEEPTKEDDKELEVKVNELLSELDKVKKEKDDLAVKFNNATETIISLNSTIEQLKPFQEQMLNAQRETKLAEQKEKYEVKFNAVNAKEKFDSDEVQSLILNSIEETDEGKDALLQLNEILFDSIKIEEVKVQTNAIAGIASKREFNSVVEHDDFDSKYKY